MARENVQKVKFWYQMFRAKKFDPVLGSPRNVAERPVWLSSRVRLSRGWRSIVGWPECARDLKRASFPWRFDNHYRLSSFTRERMFL